MSTSFGWEGKGRYGSFHQWMNVGCASKKLWDPLRTHAIPEHLRGVFMTRRYTNAHLPLPYQQCQQRIMTVLLIYRITTVKLLKYSKYFLIYSVAHFLNTYMENFFLWKIWIFLQKNMHTTTKYVLSALKITSNVFVTAANRNQTVLM